LKIVALSDTHGLHRKVQVPEGDILIHAGDFTNVGELEQVKDFNDWLGELPHKYKVVIAGNHDLSLERNSEVTEPMLTNCIYLKDKSLELKGLKMWGSPWTPFFLSDYWVFHKRGSIAQYEHWQQIPEGLDILITHGPPNRVLDRTLEGDSAGDVELMQRLVDMEERPRFHFFGHIHEGYGFRVPNYGVKTYNVSVCTRMYKPTNPPVVIEV
jgi:predicted phosphohydrolase